jgi:hypothetical protein
MAAPTPPEVSAGLITIGAVDAGVTGIASPATIASASAIANSVMGVRSSGIAADVKSSRFAAAVKSSAIAAGWAARQ